MDELEQSVRGASGQINRGANVQAVPQASEAADTIAVCMSKWAKIMRLFNASGESAQDEVFAAVNMYFLQNGTSYLGKYSKPIRTAGGVEVVSGEITKITGRAEGEIRQFMRGRLADSYKFLKYNPAVTEDENLVAKAQNASIPRNQTWLLADWLGDNCPYFVGDEAEVYRKYRASTIALANYRRTISGSDRQDPVVKSAPEAQDVGHGSYAQNHGTGLY